MKTVEANAAMALAVPEEVGISSQRLDRINRAMEGLVDQGQLAGLATLIFRRARPVHLECFGMSDIESAKPIRPDTIFRIYSMTKPITSVALMMLYEEGRFQLEEPVTKYIPAFGKLKVLAPTFKADPEYVALDRDITIRHLLTHTSGMGYGLFEDSPVEDLVREAGLLDPFIVLRTPLEEMVYRLARIPLAFQPGEGWRYSLATDVIGYLISVISDTPFDVFLEERIFGPLAMEDTGFYVPREKADRLAAMYGPDEEGKLTLIDPPAKSLFLEPNYHPSGGAGLLSTITDYLRFARMLLNRGELDGRRLLGRKTVEFMTANHLPDALIPIQVGPNPVPGHGFGLGFRVLVDAAQYGVLSSAGAYGWGGAASTFFWVDPREELVGLLMPQFLPSSLLPIPLREIFQNLTYQALVE